MLKNVDILYVDLEKEKRRLVKVTLQDRYKTVTGGWTEYSLWRTESWIFALGWLFKKGTVKRARKRAKPWFRERRRRSRERTKKGKVRNADARTKIRVSVEEPRILEMLLHFVTRCIFLFRSGYSPSILSLFFSFSLRTRSGFAFQFLIPPRGNATWAHAGQTYCAICILLLRPPLASSVSCASLLPHLRFP